MGYLLGNVINNRLSSEPQKADCCRACQFCIGVGLPAQEIATKGKHRSGQHRKIL